MERFSNREEAGRFLARSLGQYRDHEDAIVLALPRGGVPVAFEVARELHLPLDVFLVRKLGFPGHEEFALGAIASGGIRVMNPAALQLAPLDPKELEQLERRENKELARREALYRGDRPRPELEGKVVILIDDGLATGMSMRAAVAALKQVHPSRIVVAVPVASGDACELLSREADEVVCGFIPVPFYSVGQWYEIFGQTSDEEVQELLEKAEGAMHGV
jgi:putative phosphoribosyl transferase